MGGAAKLGLSFSPLLGHPKTNPSGFVGGDELNSRLFESCLDRANVEEFDTPNIVSMPRKSTHCCIYASKWPRNWRDARTQKYF
jgi:hypothetical protein